MHLKVIFSTFISVFYMNFNYFSKLYLIIAIFYVTKSFLVLFLVNIKIIILNANYNMQIILTAK